MSRKEKNILVFADKDRGGVIHVANIKGGVGKSTVATNVAASFAKRGPTLLIDLDVQGSATHALGREPDDAEFSSRELFSRRFYYDERDEEADNDVTFTDRLKSVTSSVESRVFPMIVGRGDISSITINVNSCLDLIPANSGLFKPVYFFHLSNFENNLNICRKYYKYIVIDTPSVWNNVTQKLFRISDMTLIPVTLNALSTRSLRSYLENVKKLAQKDSRVRIRIIKNEVFGNQKSAIKGKTRTMHENRSFLEQLCEQMVIKNNSGASLLPQSIIFNFEIPETAVVRDAQDLGKTVDSLHQYSSVSKAFNALCKKIQYVLNNPISNQRLKVKQNVLKSVDNGLKGLGLAAAMVIMIANPDVKHPDAPRPVAPQQVVEDRNNTLAYRFNGNESVYRIAKYAICRLSANIPSSAEVSQYVLKTVKLYNQTRRPHEKKISMYKIPEGTELTFLRPEELAYKRSLLPVYEFFGSVLDDSIAYITGDWCERGTGGGTPHYGIDVAGKYGSEIITPISGRVYTKNTVNGGRTVGVVDGKLVLFFMHMGKVYLKTGDRVESGQRVGTVGMTGHTSGPHVHVGYGVEAPGRRGVNFGGKYYRLTDPKLFYYRHQYLSINKFDG